MRKQWSKEAEIKKNSHIYNLDLYLNETAIIRIRGRIGTDYFFVSKKK